MSTLKNKQILLGISGGVAAYKAAYLARRLIEQGANVLPAMTRSACEFIQPLTFQSITGNPVATDLLDPAQERSMGHINLARQADMILIAPATAHIIAKLAHGLADDLLTTLCLATESPIFIAPAMNNKMWSNPATQNNIRLLQSYGMQILGPDSGDQACGEQGPGRLREPDALINDLLSYWQPIDDQLKDRSILITAGPTVEPIDPVRYITNRSSGKMGFALANAAARSGANVTLISGPVAQETPHGCNHIRVGSAQQMHESVMTHIENQDIFIAAAAVADYTPNQTADKKIKKHNNAMTLELTKTRDILSDVAAIDNGPFTVGFAAETHDLETYARDKLERKRLDMIAANWVNRSEGGFDSDDNSLHVFWNDGEMHLPMASKNTIAAQLLSLIATRSSQ